MKGLILFLAIVLSSCGGGGSGGGGAQSKSLFSRWTHSSGYYIDLTGNAFNENQIFFTRLRISQKWIDALNDAGRDTTGLVAGTYFLCELDLYIVGNQSSGNIATNHDDIDTPEHNACLEWDNNCQIGSCNFSADHLYTKNGNDLTIDYFGSEDGGLYGVHVLQ